MDIRSFFLLFILCTWLSSSLEGRGLILQEPDTLTQRDSLVKDTLEISEAERAILEGSLPLDSLSDSIKSEGRPAEGAPLESAPPEGAPLESAPPEGAKLPNTLAQKEVYDDLKKALEARGQIFLPLLDSSLVRKEKEEKLPEEKVERESKFEEFFRPKQPKEGQESSSKEKEVEEEEEEDVKSTIKNLTKVISFWKIFWSILFLLISYYFISFIIKALNFFAEKSAKFRITLKAFVPPVRIFGWLLVVYIILAGIFSPPIETIVAVTASVGVAIGFASQDILKNIFGGIMILFDQPFKVGDKIEVGSHYGEVVEIGLRSTRIVTPDDSLVSLPNADVMNQGVSNANAGEPNCQVVAELYLPITIDTDEVRRIATESAQVSRYIYLDKPITILFINEVHRGSSIYKMRLKAYVMDIRSEFMFKSDMTELVINQLIKQGIMKNGDLIS